MRGPIVVVGDAMLDVDVDGRASRLCPDAPVPVLEDAAEQARPGGAALAAAMAAADGQEVVLVTPLHSDEAGERLLSLLSGISVVGLPVAGETAVKRRYRASGHTLLRVDRGGAGTPISALPPVAQAAVREAAAVLVADYGRGVTAFPPVRELLAQRAVSAPLVWDPHPRGSEPVAGAHLVTPNAAEVETWASRSGLVAPEQPALQRLTSLSVGLRSAWQSRAVAVTRGEHGALLCYGSEAPVVVPAPALTAGDPCGAGDRFAVTATTGLAGGLLLTEAVQAAVAAASAFVGAGGAAGFTVGRQPPATAPVATRDADAVVAAVRAVGGVVVATGGCFDLLHAGHVATLRSARNLGDCLVVCLNSDASIRRLKGPGRPLVTATDRARVLEALSYVDAVAVFDEDAPDTVLRRLRPDVWVKGGDYTGADLPEAATLRSWGGQAVVVPYIEGRSTSSLVELAATTHATRT